MAKNTEKRGAPTNIALDASKQKQFNQKVHRVKQKVPVKDGAPQSGVVYVSHLPWGFEEEPLKEYFKQFGTIKQLRVSRSKKTGNTRGYAYIQFAHDEVAKIVAETMNNYLMFGKLIKCHHLATPHPNTFKHAQRRFIKPMAVERAVEKHNSIKSDETVEKSQNKVMGKFTKLQAKLAAKGIQYRFDDSEFNAEMKKLRQLMEGKKKARLAKKGEAKKKRRQVKEVEKLAKKASDDKISEDGDDDDKDDVTDDDDDDDDDDDASPSEMSKPKAASSLASKPGKPDRPKTPKNVTVTPKSAKMENESFKSAKKTPKRQSLIPKEVDTPKGKMNVLVEDSSEEEITFKTPPFSIKSSKLDDTLKSMNGTPLSTKKTPKRKLDQKTPIASAKKAKSTPKVDVQVEKTSIASAKKAKSTPKVEVPEKKAKFTPKSAKRMNIPVEGDSEENGVATPKSNVKIADRTRSGKKTPAKQGNVIKTPPSQKRRKSLKK